MAETIGERIRRLRVELGLSQRELESPGVTYAYISRLEHGSRLPSEKALLRLSDGAAFSIGTGTLPRFSDAGLVFADGARIRAIPFDQLPPRT